MNAWSVPFLFCCCNVCLHLLPDLLSLLVLSVCLLTFFICIVLQSSLCICLFPRVTCVPLFVCWHWGQKSGRAPNCASNHEMKMGHVQTLRLSPVWARLSVSAGTAVYFFIPNSLWSAKHPAVFGSLGMCFNPWPNLMHLPIMGKPCCCTVTELKAALSFL